MAIEAMVRPAGGRGGLGAQMGVFEGLGIDGEAAMKEMREKFRTPEFRNQRPNTFRDYVVPQLLRIDLITDRTAVRYRDLGFEV